MNQGMKTLYAVTSSAARPAVILATPQTVMKTCVNFITDMIWAGKQIG
jgi:hypothetical protein